MNFDLVIGFDANDRHAVFAQAINCVKEKYPQLKIQRMVYGIKKYRRLQDKIEIPLYMFELMDNN